MEYYDIEIFKTDTPVYWLHTSHALPELPTYKEMKHLYCVNDRYFLKRLHYYCSYDERAFSNILASFLFYFEGDPKQWLHHTMDIVYMFGDTFTDIWLTDEMVTAISGKPVTFKEKFYKEYNSGAIHTRKTSLPIYFEEFASIHGGKPSYYNKLWKKANKKK